MVRAQPAADRGDIVLGWLTKVVAGLALAAVVIFDGVSLAAAHLGAADDANAAALAASDAWSGGHNLATAYNAAESYAEQHGESVLAKTFQVASDGAVSLQLRRTATTMLLGHLPWLGRYTTFTVSGQGQWVNS